jgi:hypothetical protein
MCEIDDTAEAKLRDRLRDLALEAQRHPRGSPERQKAVGCLLGVIQQSGKLCRPRVPQHLTGSYSEIYAIARQQLFCYIFDKIDNYKAERGEVMQWVNFLLTKRFPDAIRELTQPGQKFPWQNVQRITADDLDEVENWLFQKSTTVSQSSSPLAADLREYLESDPDEILQGICVKNNPHATFQAIAIAIADGRSWKQISEEFNVKIPTLSSFYQRNLKKFIPQFQAYLSP